tara:strand:+ start:943 stop:1380 length:438 start_codon:yes stop_codon:yes gene_type:complete
MKTNAAGLNLIRAFEGLKLEPYKCAAGVPTIGYGSTYGIDGQKLNMSHRQITEDEAKVLLAREVAHAERQVARLIYVSVTANQFSAFVSFTFNVGGGAFQSSTMRRKFNREEDCADEFLRWKFAGGRVLAGLLRRRYAERALFLK